MSTISNFCEPTTLYPPEQSGSGLRKWLDGHVVTSVREHLYAPAKGCIKRLFENGRKDDVCAATDVTYDTVDAISSVKEVGNQLLPAPKTRGVSKFRHGKFNRSFFSSPGFAKVLAYASLVIAVIGVPVLIKYFYDSAEEFVGAVKDRETEFIADDAVDMAMSAGYLAWTPAAIATSLSTLKVVAESALKWVPVVNIAFSIISAVGAVKASVNAYQIYKQRKIYLLETSGAEINQNFLNVKKFVKGLTERQTDKYLCSDKEWLLSCLEKVEKGDDEKKGKIIFLVRRCLTNNMTTQMLHSTALMLVPVATALGYIPVTAPLSLVVYLASAVSMFAVDLFSWYQWHSFHRQLDAL